MQRSLRGALEQLGTENYVAISISVEPNDTAELLVDYAEREGFNWIFAAGSPELVQALVDQYGRSVITPPVSPHFIISATGEVSQFPGGPHTTEDLLEEFASVIG